jgi:proline iminopeptidase
MTKLKDVATGETEDATWGIERMSESRERMIATNGVKLWTARQGYGVPVALLHGGPGACDYLEPVAEIIEDLAECLRFDQRGCGRSEKLPPYDMPTAIEDLEGLRNACGVEQWTLVGHSWGCCLALAYAVAHPDRVTSLVLISPHALLGRGPWNDEYRTNFSLRLNRETLARYKELRDRLPPASPDGARPIQDELVDIQRPTDYAPATHPSKFITFDHPPAHEVNAQLNKAWNAHAADPKFQSAAKALKIPKILIHGEEDPRPAWPNKQFAEDSTGSLFRLIPKSGHYPWVESPQVLAHAIRSFLVRHAGATTM